MIVKLKDLVCLIIILALSAVVFTNSRASGRDDSSASAEADADANATADAAADAIASATGGMATGGSATVNNNARALSLSGSGMEIRDCIATHAILFGLWQGTHINKPCVADRLDAVGKHEEAAQMRCSMHSFKRVFGRGQSCIDAIILTTLPEPAPAPAAPLVMVPPDDDEADDEAGRVHDDISARLDAMDAARAANIRRYNRDRAAQKQANADFYEGYIEKFEVIQRIEKSDICCTTEELSDNE